MPRGLTQEGAHSAHSELETSAEEADGDLSSVAGHDFLEAAAWKDARACHWSGKSRWESFVQTPDPGRSDAGMLHVATIAQTARAFASCASPPPLINAPGRSDFDDAAAKASSMADAAFTTLSPMARTASGARRVVAGVRDKKGNKSAFYFPEHPKPHFMCQSSELMSKAACHPRNPACEEAQVS